MAIGFYNFQKLHDQEFQKAALKRMEEIISKNAFIDGEYNKSFEAGFAKMQQAKHCELVANGTDALEIALQAFGIKAGDKVAVQAISFYASAEAIINVGGIPVFVDVEPETGLMDIDSLKRTVDAHDIKAVMCVHIYGLPADIEAIEAICNPKGIKIVEDGAQSQGGFYANGKPIGSSNNLITYSFYPTKNLGAFGDAGAILCNDDALADEVNSIKNHGRSPNGHRLIGRNSRCDSFQAAVLDLKLNTIEQNNIDRKKIAGWYFEELKSVNIGLVPEKYIELSSWHLFPVRLENKEKKNALREFLGSKQIGSAPFYEKAMPEEAPLLKLEGEKENSVKFAHQTLCLPMNPFMSQDDVKEVAAAIKEFLA
jgi:dTDP-4-amino-4,6-dideoxygalactose transaminase